MIGFVRQPAVAGQFYPSNKADIEKLIDSFDVTEECTLNTPYILIVPHAGYVYSGKTAKYGFECASKRKNIEHVILLGPSHHYPLSNIIVSPAGKWIIPDDEIYVKEDLLEKFLSYDRRGTIMVDVDPFIPEHSLEVELPFIRKYFPNADLLPFIVPALTPDRYKSFAYIINDFIKEYSNTIIVVSSDMYHGEDHNLAKEVNNNVLKILQNGSSMDFMKYAYDFYMQYQSPVACGEPGIIVSMYLSEIKGLKWNIMHMTTSADITGKNDGYVVGYLSAVAYKKENNE